MKIGILTWYKSLNHGAVLQAYASQKFLESKGYASILLDYDRNTNAIENRKEKFIRRISSLNLNHLIMKLNLKKWNNEKRVKFDSFINENLKCGKKYYLYDNIDKVMIGSDMVFDYFEGYNPFMYGKDVHSKNIFSYAACFGYTTVDSFHNYKNKDEIVSYISKMAGVGYRDDNTNEILVKECGIENATKNIDPVLLYGFQNEKKEWNNNGWKNKEYILVYSYQSNLNKKNEIKDIKKFAKEKNLKIISVGYNHPWCDQCINANPQEFVELFANANYIVTDTFHGLVFSIIFNKNFAVITRNNSFKILDLLKELNIRYDNNKGIYEKLLDCDSNFLDYDSINKKLNLLRKESEKYLLKQLGDSYE